ncbi:MAG: hypothetical protein HQK96_06895 [Nitrospirae bacterium]|nr:hypothetical protein [Nitrospirota bacterium]
MKDKIEREPTIEDDAKHIIEFEYKKELVDGLPVSYSKTPKEFAERLLETLKSFGYSVQNIPIEDVGKEVLTYREYTEKMKESEPKTMASAKIHTEEETKKLLDDADEKWLKKSVPEVVEKKCSNCKFGIKDMGICPDTTCYKREYYTWEKSYKYHSIEKSCMNCGKTLCNGWDLTKKLSRCIQKGQKLWMPNFVKPTEPTWATRR